MGTAAAVAPEVAGPTTAFTFDWVTKLVVTEAASAVSDLLSLSTTSSFLPSIPPALLISSTASWAPFCSAVPYAALLKVAPLNGTYFLFLILVMILYMASVTFVKHLYIKKYHEWL